MGEPIHVLLFGRPKPSTLILAGVHGDEPKGVRVARQVAECLADPQFEANAAIVAVLNPDGFARRRRCNANGIDLNRNLPTRDWRSGPTRSRYYAGPKPASEPETRAIIKLIDSLQPARIITIHSINRRRHCVNYDGPAIGLARPLAARNGYPVRPHIGYPTPGSLGTWAGRERGIATITLELPAEHSPKRCWHDNRDGLLRLCRS